RALPLSAAQNTPVPTDDNYVYSITTQSLDLDYLMAVTVTVSYNDPQDTKPTSVSLVRWMVDPDYLDQLEAEAAAAEEEAAAAAEAEGQDA
ncbi:MAG: hypothetical protein KDA60_09640, partial [Planctomycetales bacterium]|nr:hypothetical protein [Planctomycetales bacterium]